MATVLDQFLAGITDLIKSRDGAKLQDFLQIEPPLPDIYRQMVDFLRQHYPPHKDAELQRRCEGLVPRTKGGSSWSAFPTFMKLYFAFLRDVNVENLLETYNMLKALLNQCILALGDSQMGVIVLPTVLYLSKVMAKLAVGLDRRPDLIAHLLRMEGRSDEETMEKVTLVEQSANVVREAFIKCLTDRSGTPGPHGKPEGRRIGIYLMANLCLKLLFQCGKLRNAEQMFASISAQSPPLAYFPACQRVTYLHYLGRYLFSNNLFFPAQIALEAAYDQCHKQALNQKRVILSYLIPCNIIMGRFPSAELLQRPEAQGLAERFVPICRLIERGDYIAFRNHLGVGAPGTEWFAQKGILLALRNRCEILVWRSLVRKVFIHGGFHGESGPQAQRGPPPFLYLNKIEAAVRWLQAQHGQPLGGAIGSEIVVKSPDRDFAGINGYEAPEPEGTPQAKYDDFLSPEAFFDEYGQRHENPTGELVDGDLDADFGAHELDPYADRKDERVLTPMMREIESILASLLSQGLMRGYLTHRNPRFAIPGARLRGPLPTGFPNVWHTIYARESEDDSVPGWVQPPSAYPFAGAGAAVGAAAAAAAAAGGRVVNLKGARPAGVGP